MVTVPWYKILASEDTDLFYRIILINHVTRRDISSCSVTFPAGTVKERSSYLKSFLST